MITLTFLAAVAPALACSSAETSGGTTTTTGAGGGTSTSAGAGGATSATSTSGGATTTSSGATTTSSGTGGGAPGTFAEVQAILNGCTTCHDASKSGLPSDPSLSLVPSDSYAALVNKDADAPCGGKRVVPGSPETSFLMEKLGPGDPCSGSHMPRPFEIGPRVDLPADKLETIRSWIAAGAKP